MLSLVCCASRTIAVYQATFSTEPRQEDLKKGKFEQESCALRHTFEICSSVDADGRVLLSSTRSGSAARQPQFTGGNS